MLLVLCIVSLSSLSPPLPLSVSSQQCHIFHSPLPSFISNCCNVASSCCNFRRSSLLCVSARVCHNCALASANHYLLATYPHTSPSLTQLRVDKTTAWNYVGKNVKAANRFALNRFAITLIALPQLQQVVITGGGRGGKVVPATWVFDSWSPVGVQLMTCGCPACLPVVKVLSTRLPLYPPPSLPLSFLHFA